MRCDRLTAPTRAMGTVLAALGANQETSEALVAEMRRAYDAQFETVAGYAAFLSRQLDIEMSMTDRIVQWRKRIVDGYIR